MAFPQKINQGIDSPANAGHPLMHLELVKKLLGRRTLFHPVFVGITHSVTASLMLSQALYWTRIWLSKPEQSHADGWFWKSQAEWQDETGLSRKEQETARRVLRTALFLDEKKQGMPSRIFFRLDLGRITESIHSADGLDWSDDYVVFQLLGRPYLLSPQPERFYA